MVYHPDHTVRGRFVVESEVFRCLERRRREKHAYRIEADTAHATFAIDGKTIATLERAQVAPEGHFEFRVGRGVNIHVVRLDVTHRLAPPRAPKRPM